MNKKIFICISLIILINIQSLKAFLNHGFLAHCTQEGCINPCCRLNWEGRVHCCNNSAQTEACCGSIYHEAIHGNGGDGSEVFAHHLALQSFALDPSKTYYQWLDYYLRPWLAHSQPAVAPVTPTPLPIILPNLNPVVAPAPTQGANLTITHSHPL